MAPIYAVDGALAVFAVAWHRLIRGPSVGSTAFFIAESAQVLAASGIVFFTGGAGSPLVFLYYPPLLLAGVVLGLPAALAITILATAGLMVAAAFAGPVNDVSPLPWWGNLAALWIVGIAAGAAGVETRKTQRAIAEAKDRAERTSNVDWLTGLYNRRHLDTLVPQEISRARRQARPVSLMILDADHLKEVNDNLGHIMGDQFLIHIAEVLVAQMRLVDTVVRYGGDEFVVVMPDTDAAGAYIPAERIRAAMDGYEVKANEVSVATSVSIGIACFPDDA